MRIDLLALALVAAIAGGTALAGDHVQYGKAKGHGKGLHGRCCPGCGEVCYPTVSKDKETKTCWEVDTKTICIPKVRFPWEAGCCGKGCGKDGCLPPKCGRTKCVNVLMKHEYECSVCKYSWDVDKDKYGKDGYDGKDKGDGGDVKDAVPPPPPVDARLQRSQRRTAPVRFEPNDTRTAESNSTTSVLKSLVR